MSSGLLRITSAAAALLLGGLLLVACESSQDKNARLKQQGAGLQEEKGVSVGQENPTVKVVEKSTITDANGTAVILRLNSSDPKDQVDVPVIFDLVDAGGESLAGNSTPGLQRTLTHAMLVPARSKSWWVNDQVFATGKPKEVKVQVGKSTTPLPKDLPDFKATPPKLETDPVDGLVAVGKVQNPTATEQRKILVTIVASKGGKPVAAGRGIVAKLKPSKAARYSVFFIGNPKGADFDVATAPTTFEGAK